MTVTAKFTGLLRMKIGRDTCRYELTDNATIADLVDAMAAELGEDIRRQVRLGYQIIVERDGGSVVAGDGDTAGNHPLSGGDVVMFLYTFAGG